MANRTREAMLQATARLLQHRGYHGTSLSDILAESGAPRGSLYFHFPGGKDQLVVEATKAGVKQSTDELRAALERAPDPARGIRAFVEAAAGLLRETGYAFGCPVAPVILDAAGGVPELAEVCRRAFEEWTGLLEDAFVRAGAARAPSRALALLVMSSIEGLLLIARAWKSTDPLRQAAGSLEAAVRAALPRERTRRRRLRRPRPVRRPRS